MLGNNHKTRTKTTDPGPQTKARVCCLLSVVCCLLYSCALSSAQGPSDSEQLFSSSVARKFYETAYELANSRDVNAPQLEQAITLLTAAMRLDSRARYVLPDMIKIACRHPDHDYSELIYQLLLGYVNESADLEVAREAIAYLLERLNAREQREKLLKEMLTSLGDKSSLLGSELAAELGLLMAEKADANAAQAYFMHAYSNNKYDKLAFAKLAELVGGRIKPAIYLEHLRLALAENPLDMQAALAFAQYTERLQLYQTAADAYEYCADLFAFLHPSEPLPPYAYLPWAIASYNTQRSPHKCLQIASDVRQSGRFDLLLEAIAGRAAEKIGDTEQAKRILQAAEDKAVQRSNSSPSELAWFYCFAAPDVNKAVEWANKAYSTEPNSATAAAILAYSLVMNAQTDWAKLLIDNYPRNQIADLTLAQIQLAQQQPRLAIETLKSAIERDPGSLAAERAKQILAQQGAQYIPPIDPDVLSTVLKNTFGQIVVPQFVTPEKLFSVQLNLGGVKFSYGKNFDATVAVTNNSADPLVISDDALFKGNIRIDADITGDLNKKIPNLLSLKIRPALPVKPGQTLSIPVRLVTRQLRQILLAFPQASLRIDFTVFIDPVITAEGRITNRLDGLKPATTVAERPRVELTGKYLRNRLDSISKGRQGQKIRTAQLFTGLLIEQNHMAEHGPLYKFRYADWMPDLLKSALVHNLADKDWIVKVHTMAAILSLPLDYELIDAVSKNLNDTHWPARLIAVVLLARSPGRNFSKVLDWTAKYDSNELVRQMAIALAAKKPRHYPALDHSKEPPPTVRAIRESPLR